MLKLWDWFKKLFHRRRSDSLSDEEIRDVTIAEKEIATGKAKTFENVDDLLADLHRVRSSHRTVRRAGEQATRKDVSKFMKHGRQAPWYRKSVKAKIQPVEEKD